MRTIIIDNYDSFTYNIFQMVAAINQCSPLIFRNDEISWQQIQKLDFDNIILSPGPGSAENDKDFGLCRDIILYSTKPVLGICLGHQGLCHYWGGKVTQAPVPVHGRQSKIYHAGHSILSNIPSPFNVVRYHSLIVNDPIPDCFEVTARTEENLIMAVAHKEKPLWGVQFHPESILTECGSEIIRNFNELTVSYLKENKIKSANGSYAQPKMVKLKKPAAEIYFHLECEVIAFDRDPGDIFKRIYGDSKNAFWLNREASSASPFSYMGDAKGENAFMLSWCQVRRQLTIDSAHESKVSSSDILSYMDAHLANINVSGSETPFGFRGGFVGYIGYEVDVSGERCCQPAADDDAKMIFPDRFICIDHQKSCIYLVTLTPLHQDRDSAWIEDVKRRIAAPDNALTQPLAKEKKQAQAYWLHSKKKYLQLIESCFSEIRSGESYEVCLTNRLYLPPLSAPFSAWQQLRKSNPSPYAAFLRFDDLNIICSSPECFLKIDKEGHVISKPIKGTRRRGRDADEDNKLRLSLLTDEKDRAENLMITDLLRNDLGRVCQVGSVQVPELMVVETYPAVHQLVSSVTGKLQHTSAISCFKAAFPGGSMTGAPKKRTMEIIDRLENRARGVYSGSIGYFSSDGSADMNIVIRTLVSNASHSVIGAGGAVIELSTPEAEVEEVMLKASALLDAVAISQNWAISLIENEHDY
ncbi:aminodeoxychorismate synthase component I [Erwinia piriflorinigrans]|uniref:aminodeoxychorismate synthase n=1 Tax=Erwinia piriflorinigrans CFBP 5888 TaxID=1161919 RepID=V5Z9H2_9GAMM|nr:aminodeoxychorismate synthase component I [Erwinia piriflorinigrans]CCG87603.1 anthranilate synthase component I [Erwinia piriflorinigrans CFBP 5888]